VAPSLHKSGNPYGSCGGHSIEEVALPALPVPLSTTPDALRGLLGPFGTNQQVMLELANLRRHTTR
jgi:hypothetical protein